MDRRYYCLWCERWMTITGRPESLCDKIEQLALKAAGLAHGLMCNDCKKKLDAPGKTGPTLTVTLRKGPEYVFKRDLPASQ